MKKLLSIMGAMAFVLVGGISLAACGGDEFKNATVVNLSEVNSYVSSKAVESGFAGYTINSNVSGMKFSATVVADEESTQASMTVEIGKESMGIYLKNNVVYVKINNEKYYKDISQIGTGNANTNSAYECIKLITSPEGNSIFSGDYVEELLASFSDIGLANVTVKKLNQDSTTKFLVESRHTIGDFSTYSSVKLVYESNILSECTFISETQEFKLETSIKKYSGTIQFPDFADYTEENQIS